MAKVDMKSYEKQMQKLAKVMESLPRDAHEEFVKNTPVRSGRARRNTRLSGNQIIADYPYSQRLDEGYSKQSPKGMTQPTEDWIQQEVDRRLKGI